MSKDRARAWEAEDRLIGRNFVTALNNKNQQHEKNSDPSPPAPQRKPTKKDNPRLTVVYHYLTQSKILIFFLKVLNPT